MTKHQHTELRNPWSPEHAESNWPRAHVLAAENAKLRGQVDQRGFIIAKLMQEIEALKAAMDEIIDCVHPNSGGTQGIIRRLAIAAKTGKTDGQAD